ncbi:UPF0058 family protein [Halorientalis salina]|uniref:UPF0058 family protein n=1 Tax=Halorientalis salina TaxID=2932266 RepID=UPI0010ACCB1A|nr:UPF0058 family protein [Halorientalis salina]
MRKDELLHLHQLLTAVRVEYERRGDVPADAFSAYDELSVSPVAAYAPKGDHKRAVRTLASTLAACSGGRSDSTDSEHPQSAAF